ncbi:MAG: aminomethyl-transferring glycine dehydrogenase, partial [Gammaproteobacteria bacterium]|nr:aminomethyl-transferring glycine dehydrogenase [Gammaproteobacteria bacterium]
MQDNSPNHSQDDAPNNVPHNASNNAPGNPLDTGFSARHIGLDAGSDIPEMLRALGYDSMQAFIAQVVPRAIFSDEPLELPDAVGEHEALAALEQLAKQNKVNRSLLGQGYYETITPPVIARNIFENPAWYTAYTPYQPEISQGRLEALLNYQTMVSDLTGLDVANASMLDEGSAAAEGMALAKRCAKNKSNVFFIDQDCFAQTIEVVQTRAAAAGFDVQLGDPLSMDSNAVYFGALLQYPGASGEVRDFSACIEQLHMNKGLVVMAADILALLLLKSPGELGADVAVGNTQRFGVPMGFGGPHAAYMATRSKYQRSLPGRLVGVSIDQQGNSAYRLALQTREQHIRREKATSNICTAQVLLAVMASMYACYHGPDGLRAIALRVHRCATLFAQGVQKLGFAVACKNYFDTISIHTGENTGAILQRAESAGINLQRVSSECLRIAFDEKSTDEEVQLLLGIVAASAQKPLLKKLLAAHADKSALDKNHWRSDPVLQHPVFSLYRTETEMLRYLRRLSDKDLALDRTMIPLGSCTMKLNAVSEMVPVSWPAFANMHPFAPEKQCAGYLKMIAELESMLALCTGYDAVSLQPNAGSQGEFAGLLAISAYHRSRGESQRDVCLIPQSAHGTNPASAQMCNMRVVVVRCDSEGNIDLADLVAKAAEHSDKLAAIMVTYPSTHGVFEAEIREVCSVVHQHGGQVYVDGANLNAMVGLCKPGEFGGDVSHLNLHKTFCIPHGGGGPGVGPVAARAHLASFLPQMASQLPGAVEVRRPRISAALFGSSSILPISWMYIRMMGGTGLRAATEAAILSANYVAQRLQDAYPVLYKGSDGLVAHECIIDLRPIKEQVGISVEDVAKRLIDYGFHAPTMSFPVAGTLMIEPTESESLAELERFCEAMLAIREEIARVERGEWQLDDNPLVNAPHTVAEAVADEWQHAYARSAAVYP